MLAETRRQSLLDLISRKGFASLEDLVELAGVSQSTIRRDLEALDLVGAIRRTHGGAVVAGGVPRVPAMPAFDDRTAMEAAAKRAIGRHAAALVADGDTVLLDGGTTTREVARALAGRRVQVVTNSLPVANLMAPHPETDLILIGGYVYPRTGVALGPIAIDGLDHIRVNHVFLGAGGIQTDGVFNSNLLLVETERAMMRCGQGVVLVADHTKFGRPALSRLCGLGEIHHMVVDAGTADAHRRMVEAAGVALHVADPDPLPAAPRATRDGSRSPS